MFEMIVGLTFLSMIAVLGLAMYARGRKYEETRRLEDVAARREDDLTWSVKYTSVAYGVQNDSSADFEAGTP